MPLPDLLQWLETVHKTGLLAIEGPEFTTTLYLREGQVVSSASTDPRSYLGQFLLAYTDLTEEDLKDAFDKQEATRVYLGKNIYIKTMLGKILVEAGKLTEEEVIRVLAIKVEETIYPAFLWPRGSFRFIDDELPPEEMVPLKLDIVHVLNRGIGRMEEWNDIRQRIPSANYTFRVVGERPPPSHDFEGRVLDLLAGGASLSDVLLRLRATEFAVHRLVARWLAEGLLALGPEQRSLALPLSPDGDSSSGINRRDPDELVEVGASLLEQRALAETVILARQAVQEDPSHGGARQLLERSERELMDSFYARMFAPDDILVLADPHTDAKHREVSPEERFLLDRIARRWTVRSIIRLSPLKEVDALAILKKLLEDGFVNVVRRE